MFDQTERNDIETVDMDVEFEDCSTELVAPDTDACRNENVRDSSGSKDTKQPLSVELELVGDTLSCKNKNNTEGGQSDSVLHASQDKEQIAGRMIQCQTFNTSVGSQQRNMYFSSISLTR